MKYFSTLTVAGLITAVCFSAPASAVVPMPGADDTARDNSSRAGLSLKLDVQFKKRLKRGPCFKGDTYNRKQRSCKGAGSAAYARGDRTAGRCKPGDRYSSRKKTCRTKDRKTYKANMKLAASFANSKKGVTERRKKRRSAAAKKHGCKSGDGWNRRRKMCVHYYKGKK